MPKALILVFAVLFFAASGYADDVGGGNIKFDSPTAGAVYFNHDYHTKTRGVRCMACHFRMFEAVSGGYKFNREKLNKRDFCEYCHNGMKGFDAKASRNCSRCHVK